MVGHDLYMAADRLREYVREKEFMDNEADTGVAEMYIKRLMDAVCHAPIMYGKQKGGIA